MDKKKSAVKTITAGLLAGSMAFSLGEAQKCEVTPPELSMHNEIISDSFKAEKMGIEIYTEDEYDEKCKQTKKSSASKTVLNIVKSGAMFLVCLIVRVMLCALASISGIPVNSFLGFVIDVIVNFMIIALLFGLIFKLMYPNRSLSELFTPKNILLMLATSVVITFSKYALAIFSDKAYEIGVVLQSIFTMCIVCCLWYKTFNFSGSLGEIMSAIRNSRKGRFLFVAMILGTLFSAVIKILARESIKVAPYVDTACVFIICALVVYCGYVLFRPTKKILLLN